MKKFKLKILSKTNKIEKDITQLTVNSETGYLTILANHIPLITTIKEGSIEWIIDDNRERVLVTQGIMKVERDEVVIFTEFN